MRGGGHGNRAALSRASPRTEVVFGALVLAQAAHSLEEYVGRLWESFPPAALLTGLLSPDREIGFIVINLGIVAFGVWCLLWPVRGAWPSAALLMWFWIAIETINGLGHPAWSLRQGGYTPGVMTAPVLLVLALWLASRLRTFGPAGSRPAHAGESGADPSVGGRHPR